MDKYKKTADKRLANPRSHGKHKIHPEILAQEAHTKGQFAARVTDEFFDEAYGEILVDYFLQWLKTEHHETKSREYLYHCAMALGSVKDKLIQMETLGKNIPTLKEMEEQFKD